MLLTQIFGLSLSALTVWGFLMAFLINVFLHFTTQQKVKTTIVVSFYIFLFYFIADDLASLSIAPNTYLNLAFFDLVTIFLIYLTIRILKLKSNISAFYVTFGLSLSAILFLLMHIDVDILHNREAWLLWDVFSFGGTFIDLTMITVLILNKDILKLHYVWKKLFNKNSISQH